MSDEQQTTNPEVRVLVVDDDSGVRMLLQTALQREGYAVVAVNSAEEALETLAGQEGQAEIQAAVVDINLPGMNGLQLCEQIDPASMLQVILLTGDDSTYSYEDAAASGACDFVLKPVKIRELNLRVKRAIEARHVLIERDRSMRELEHLSITDGLTGLYNSRHFFHRLRVEMARSERYAHALSLMVIDLDKFKQLNDTYGHQEGDHALQCVARTISAAIRKPDSAYRYGGEEFTVVLPETDGEAALLVAERLLDEIGATGVCSARNPDARITASIGVAQWRVGEGMRDLMRRADVAMYEAKQKGRNRVVSTADMD